MFSDNPLFKTLIDWINFIWVAIPVRLRPSMLELLFGAMICKKGHITTALLAIRYQLSWTSYFKIIEKGRYFWLAIAKQWFKLILRVLPEQHLLLAIDDFITPRASKKAPSVGLHYDHAKKPNRPKFLWGQMRVSLAVIGSKGQKTVALPLLLRLMGTVGNRNKLNAAWLLMKLLLHWKPKNLPATVLIDAWYMKANLVLKLVKEHVSVIGQVRKDTALYLPPVEPDVNLFGLKDAWEQTRQVLARWTMILCMAYGLPRLLSLCFDANTVESLFSIPWRHRRPITAGWIAEIIRVHFYRFPIRALWNRKLKKYGSQKPQ